MRSSILARCALLAALMCVCAWLSFPVGDITVTAQTFALFLTLCILGGKYGSLVCLVYLLLGAVGLPVFSGFRGGLGALLGTTGGYIWGFLAAALLYWLITACFGTGFPVRLTALTAGLTACYAIGTGWYIWVYGSTDAASIGAVVLKCVVPYLIPDLIKLAGALFLTEKLKRHLA